MTAGPVTADEPDLTVPAEAVAPRTPTRDAWRTVAETAGRAGEHIEASAADLLGPHDVR